MQKQLISDLNELQLTMLQQSEIIKALKPDHVVTAFRICKNSHMTMSNFFYFKPVLVKYFILWQPQAVKCFHSNSVQMPWQAVSFFFFFFNMLEPLKL